MTVSSDRAPSTAEDIRAIIVRAEGETAGGRDAARSADLSQWIAEVDVAAEAEPLGPATPQVETADAEQNQKTRFVPEESAGDLRDDEGDDTDDAPPPIDESTGDENGPSDPPPPPGEFDPAIVEECSRLDHSDTDNGWRLIHHFGEDLVVMRQAAAQKPAFVVWVGDHWDIDGGGPASMAIAQKVGGRIALEADFITATLRERRAIEAGEKAEVDFYELALKSDPTDEDKLRMRSLQVIAANGRSAREDIKKRQVARRKFAVSSKNKPRLEAMLACAAPHIQREPELFNADPFKLATVSHTLSFRRVADPECPDPDAVRMMGAVEAVTGHRRQDWITRMLPVAYDPAATCPLWLGFMQRFQPIAAVRRAVQASFALGLLGVTEQKLFFHYGSGANGKSVAMETIMRVLGPLGLGLPAESITGSGERGAGQANPDIARLPGVRCLRVLEVPADKPLQEEFVKKITGGEALTARALFQGYFEFRPVFTVHMSGNGYPRIDGTDNGIWRRMVVFHWPVTLADEEQRNFEEVLAEFVPEYPGILNWLIEGALIYLTEGLILPAEVRAATKEYRDEMDPIGMFVVDCVAVAPGESIAARELYRAYEAWSDANAKRPISPNKFGRVMKARFRREDGAIHRYMDCRLHDVPAPAPRSPLEDDYGHHNPHDR